MPGDAHWRCVGHTALMNQLRWLALVALLLQSDWAAAKWWINRFEIFDGYPRTSPSSNMTELYQNVDGALDVSAEARSPLPADATEREVKAYRREVALMKREVETYLHEIALYLERKKFPQPAYDPPVTGSDGSKVLRVYYYDFPPVDNCKGGKSDNKTPAKYSSPIGGGRAYIEINAAQFATNGKLTPKNYADLAHELFHAVQAATQTVQKGRGNLGEWIVEGQAEAFGHDMARILRGVKHSNDVSRWGLRRYNQPLHAIDDSACDKPKAYGRQQSYQTSSWWRYLAERHYLRQQPLSREAAMPGPDLPQGYDTDYSYLVNMMKEPVGGKGAGAELDWLDGGLRRQFKQGLRPTFSEFLGVFADYGKYRPTGNQPATARDWLARALTMNTAGKPNDCVFTRIDAKALRDVWVPVKLAANAGACIELAVGSTGGPQDWIIQSEAGSVALTRQLAMILAGGQQSVTSALIDTGTAQNPPASWFFTLEPDRNHILVLSNVAETPSQTQSQDIRLRITLDGYDGPQPERPPPKPSARPNSGEVAPGPRGANEARERRRAAAEPGYDGLDSVSWEYKPGGQCGEGWRFYCVGGAVISMGQAPGGGFHVVSPDAMGGMFTEMLGVGKLDLGYIMRWEEYVDETAWTAVTLAVPGVDYGFTGTVTDAMITLAGSRTRADRSSMSARPQSKWSPCAYGPPRGSVTILEFSRTLIRGRYEARLRERPKLRPNYRERCPKLPVAQVISGEFVLAAPWLYDDRHEPDTSWVEEDIIGDLNQMVPAGMTLPPVEQMKASPPSQAGNGGGRRRQRRRRPDGCAGADQAR